MKIKKNLAYKMRFSRFFLGEEKDASPKCFGSSIRFPYLSFLSYFTKPLKANMTTSLY